jgi:hypothetical protein
VRAVADGTVMLVLVRVMLPELERLVEQVKRRMEHSLFSRLISGVSTHPH